MLMDGIDKVIEEDKANGEETTITIDNKNYNSNTKEGSECHRSDYSPGKLRKSSDYSPV
jgi:hypothetical protein